MTHISDIALILLIIVGALFLVEFIYYFVFYNSLFLYVRKEKHRNDDDIDYKPLSVIIVAKDSFEDLKKCLAAVLEQEYPLFEVIVIYEQNEGMFEDELKLMEEKHKNLYHTFIPDSSRYISHKKLAVSMGLKASKYDYAVFIEPDAYPATNLWLKNIGRNFTEDTDIVIGYSNYENQQGYFNRKIIFDRFLDSVRSLSWGILSKPYTASGYNLAYRKSLYYNNNGFSSNLNLQRGEDDIFVNKCATKYNTKIELSPESIVRISSPVHKFMWKQEKMSKAITNSYCKGFGNSFVNFETITRLLFFISVAVSIAWGILTTEPLLIIIPAILLFFFYIIEVTILRNISKSIHEKRFFFSLLWFNLFQPFWNVKYSLKRIFFNNEEYIRK